LAVTGGGNVGDCDRLSQSSYNVGQLNFLTYLSPVSALMYPIVIIPPYVVYGGILSLSLLCLFCMYGYGFFSRGFTDRREI